jgi:hypothetical protein
MAVYLQSGYDCNNILVSAILISEDLKGGEERGNLRW